VQTQAKARGFVRKSETQNLLERQALCLKIALAIIEAFAHSA